MIDRKIFYATVRLQLFDGFLKTQQVEGMNRACAMLKTGAIFDPNLTVQNRLLNGGEFLRLSDRMRLASEVCRCQTAFGEATPS